MNRIHQALGLGLLLSAAALFTAGCTRKQPPVFSTLHDPANVAQLKQFVAEKAAQARGATNADAPGLAPFFAAARSGDWLAISNAFENLRKHAGQYEGTGKVDERLRGPGWEAVKEVWGTFYYFGVGDEKYSAAYANDIIHSIPPGSIYFGGTDPGRFLITGMQKSQVAGDPFFTLTQNALADGTYVDYLRSIYGNKIYIPTAEDLQKAFADFTADAGRRLEKHQLKPGEDLHKDAAGKVQVSGQVAVMEINGLLVKTILEKNPGPDFYLEESFPLDWMYPQLEPHGLIFKLDRQPMATLPGDLVQRDHDYWAQYVAPMIGGWLGDETSVAEVAAFADQVQGQKKLAGFTGDPRFIRSADTQKMFSKLRSSIAGLYAWRASHAAGADDQERMAREADFAFRQAWALCPYAPEATYRYVNFLLEQKRGGDALLVAETAAKMPASEGAAGAQLRSLVQNLKQFQKAH